MSLLLETIRIVNGRVLNIQYHNRRFNNSRAVLFNCKSPINLRKFIKVPINLAHQVVKCRITYNQEICSIEYLPYKIKSISSLRIIHDNELNYKYKFLDRTNLDSCYAQRQMCDDILIVKNGSITDTYYGNVALLHNNIWYTPKFPLLMGTRRQNLLDKGRILEKDIHLKNLRRFSRIAIFNAMIPMGSCVLSTKDLIE